MNVEEQIADIRERVAAIETKLCLLQTSLENQPGIKVGGQVVFPVAAVVTILEIVKAFLGG